jgi:hypothetical protein
MPAMSLPAAGGSNRYGTNHCYRAHLGRRCRRAPGPGDVGDYRHKAWIFDVDRGETGDGDTLERGAMQHHRNLAIPNTLADVCHPDRMNEQHGPATTEAIGAAVWPSRTTTKPTRKDLQP